MAEVLKQAQKYINLEEELDTKRLRKVASSDRRAPNYSRKRDEANKASRNSAKDSPNPFKQFSLSITSAQMVNYLEGKKFVRWPKKIVSNQAKRDHSRYYAFHEEVGHTTKECRVLKNEVLKLIQSNYLKEFMSE